MDEFTVILCLVVCVMETWGVPVVGVVGEVSFDLRPAGAGAGAEAGPQRARGDNVTAAPPADCVYQYPETKQVDAMLSNMMNQLTKVFVRVHKYMSPWARRRGAKRYAVVGAKQTDFFDHIYANMTEEYRRFANETQARVPRASGDPCRHQREIRDVWRALLDTSQRSVRRAALQCVEGYLRAARCRSARVRRRAASLLRRELARVRSDQLALLCDTFQLCYHDLL